MDSNEAIKPVTFIEDEIKIDENINSVFLQPYEMGCLSDIVKSKIIDEFKKDEDSIYMDDIRADFIYKELKVRDDIIHSYIIQNATDLFISSYTFIHDKYIPYFKIKNPNIKIDVDDIIYDDRSLIYNVLTGSIKQLDLYNIDSMIDLFLTQYMDRLFTEIQSVYISYITDEIFYIYRLKSCIMKNTYNNIYELVYNKTPDKEISHSMMFQFTLTTVRDIVSSELTRIRYGLICITRTAKQMYLNKYFYIFSICDPEARTKDLLNGSKYYRNLISTNNLLLEEGGNNEETKENSV